MPSELFHATPVAAVVAELGESPVWDEEAGLRWLDVTGKQLLTLEPDGIVTAVSLEETVTAVELGSGRDLMAVTSNGFGSMDPETGKIHSIVKVLHCHCVTMNDGAIDPQGRYWAGSAVRDGTRRGALYCLEGNHLTTQIHQIGMSNGIDWSPSGDVMYHVDTASRMVTSWRYNAISGEASDPRTLCTVPPDIGLPDGLAVSADGAIWLAIWGPGQVWRLDPHEGAITAIVEIPTPFATSCAFGGCDLSTLYITTANHENPPGGGLLYSVDLSTRGIKPRRYAGPV